MFEANFVFEKKEAGLWQMLNADPLSSGILGSGMTAVSSWIQDDLQFHIGSIQWQIEALGDLSSECMTAGNSCEEFYDEDWTLVRVLPEYSSEKVALLEKATALFFLNDLFSQLHEKKERIELTFAIHAEGNRALQLFKEMTNRKIF